MQFKIQMIIQDEHGETKTEDIITLDKPGDKIRDVGLSLQESQELLKALQKTIICHQAEHYTKAHIACPHCQKKRRTKGQHTIQYRTLFGIVAVRSPRVYRCHCEDAPTKTVSLLTDWLVEHNSPELQYIETKWASLMSYGLTVDLLKDILPVSESLNAVTVRNHLHSVAKRQEIELEGKPDHLSGAPYEWEQLPKPGKPMVVGIDGGYVRNWHEKRSNFEVVVGKSWSKDVASKRFGSVQIHDSNPRRRLMSVLSDQGMQANHQITFLSDGADNVRSLQYNMYPESEHILDWFHVTMRLTVLSQFAKGLENSDPEAGETVKADLKSAKWYLWHGNVEKALWKIDDCCWLCDDDELHYEKRKKFYKHLVEMYTYIQNNRQMIPNYGEKYRYGETISTAFVESTVNEVVAKRMVKKQQMQWTHEGAHYLLQTRTAVLNGNLQSTFERWYANSKIADSEKVAEELEIQKAA